MSNRFKAHSALLLCALLWGATFVIVKNALVDISVFGYLALRFSLGALPLALFYRKELRKLTPADIRAGLAVGLFMFGGYAFQTADIALSTPSKAAFITGFSVVLIPILLALIWRRRINAWAWGGALGSFAGLYFLTVPRQGIANLNGGDLLVMVCAVLYALQVIYIEKYSAVHSLAALGFLQVLLAATLSTLCIPIMSAVGWEKFHIKFTSQMIFGVVVTALFTTSLAYPLLVWAQRHTTATNTALILAGEPVFAAFTSYFMLGERLGNRALLGAALILGGIIVAEWKGHPPTPGTVPMDA